MRAVYLASVIDEPLLARRYRLLAAGGIVLALLFVVMSLGGLLAPATTYARETAEWRTQAIAQDWFDLVVAAPMLVVTAFGAARGSRRALLVYAGTLLFAVYTAVIYAFAVHLNAMFLVYCAALGIALYTLAGACARLWQARSGLRVDLRLPSRSAGGFLVGIGVGFALLWLAQLVPAALTQTVPAELAATGLATNPVHVLDLAFILPLHIIAGVALWRMRSPFALLAPIVLVFGALMASSIAVLAAMSGSGAVALAMGVIALISTGLGVMVTRGFR